MKTTTLYQKNYSAFQTYALLDFNINFENDVPSDDIARTVIEITERMNIGKYVDLSSRRLHGHDAMKLLRCILLGFADDGYISTRKLERKTRTDIRYRFLTGNESIGHSSFQRFMQNDLLHPVEDIFYELNDMIHHDDRIDIAADILTIDGSKFEANANKNTFVWKKSTKRYYMNAWKQFINLIGRLNAYFRKNGLDVFYSKIREPNPAYMLEIADRIEKYMESSEIKMVSGKGNKKSAIQKMYEEMKSLCIRMYKYMMHFDILQDRNSFSKTDPDATFMHMKWDYYNHTNIFKPGYNVQFGISGGFIRNILITSDGNDLPTLIPFLQKYKDRYGKYPSIAVCDAGYGSYDNYCFCEENNIEYGYIKYSGIYKKNEKITKKNRYLKRHMKRNDEGLFVCPEGHVFKPVATRTDRRGLYDKVNIQCECAGCRDCPFKSRCTKSAGNRTMTLCRKLEDFHEHVDASLDTPVGRELMTARQVFSEGAFGIIKQDYGYDRLRRRGNSNVSFEIFMVAIGFNIRKYHNMIRKRKPSEESMKCC